MDKLDFKPKTVTGDEAGHYIIIKGIIQQEDLTIVNIYAPNMGAHKCIRLITNIKDLIVNNTRIVGDFNTPLTARDRSSKQKINKETMALNDTLDQMDLTDILRTFRPKTTEYTFFSSAQRTFCRIDNILGHKSSLNKYKEIEIGPCIFSDHNTIKLEVNRKKIIWKDHKYMEVKEHPTKE